MLPAMSDAPPKTNSLASPSPADEVPAEELSERIAPSRQACIRWGQKPQIPKPGGHRLAGTFDLQVSKDLGLIISEFWSRSLIQRALRLVRKTRIKEICGECRMLLTGWPQNLPNSPEATHPRDPKPDMLGSEHWIPHLGFRV